MAIPSVMPFWNREAQKSAVETARDVVKAFSARKLRANDLTERELRCYTLALHVLSKQLEELTDNLSQPEKQTLTT